MSENKTSHKRPVVVASTVLILGTAASLAINAKAISLTDTPEAGAYVSGLAWPLALLLVIELMIHTPWMNNWRDRATKGAALVIVGGIAAWISYWHGVHVLAHWSYDAVGQHVGPLVADVAMAVATLALNRIGQARRVAKDEVATVASPATAPATGQLTVAKVLEAKDQATLATWMDEVAKPAPAIAEPSLAEDWGNLEEELAAWTAEAAAAPEPAAAPETAQEPITAPVQTSGIKVPAEAAKRIQEALAENPKAAATALAADLVEAGLAASDRTGRRYVAAVKNGTARVA